MDHDLGANPPCSASHRIAGVDGRQHRWAAAMRCCQDGNLISPHFIVTINEFVSQVRLSVPTQWAFKSNRRLRHRLNEREKSSTAETQRKQRLTRLKRRTRPMWPQVAQVISACHGPGLLQVTSDSSQWVAGCGHARTRYRYQRLGTIQGAILCHIDNPPFVAGAGETDSDWPTVSPSVSRPFLGLLASC